jgi:nucleoside-specific outer membrane channel protein Tsx
LLRVLTAKEPNMTASQNKTTILLTIISSFFYCSTAFAAKFHNPSISYLYGDNFVIEPSQQSTFTFEYAAAWDYIDLFMFAEKKFYSGSGSSYYGEFSPRVKLYQFKPNFLLKKITLATTFERGKNGVKADLVGFGIDFNTDTFNYLTSNIYHRDAPNKNGYGWQLTSTWSYSTEWFELPILLDGYLDWVFSGDEIKNFFHFNPQIKLDMKKILNSDKQWYLGLEYDYWENKYGIENSADFDTNQNTASLLVKYHF